MRSIFIAALFLTQFVHAETATLQHDNSGNVTQRVTPLGTTTYQYDALDRMTNESGPAKTQSFNYDANGNRLKDGPGSVNNYTIDPNSNRILTTPAGTPVIDAAGRMTADGTGRILSYNQAGQLYQVKQGSTLLATYYYDANGLRSRKVTTASAPQGAQTILFEYDEEGHLIAEISGTGAPLHTYAWRDNTPVAQIDYQPSRRIIYYETDHLNTPRAATDSTGKVVWRWESDAFGTTLPNEDPGNTGSKTTVNLRFGGWYADVESGLFYAMFRYYSPPAGRFITPDPIGLAGGSLSTYTYVDSNPVNDIDPLGLMGSGVARTLPRYVPQPGGGVSDWGGPATGSGWRGLPDGAKYGWWGGKEWSGGPSGDKSPMDSSDACYMKHDKCYDKCRGLPDPELRRNYSQYSPYRACIQTCNKGLIKDLNGLPDDPKKWPSPPPPGMEDAANRFRDAAKIYFR